MRRSMLIAAVGLTAVVGLAGCGSSKSSEGASATTSAAVASGDATVASFTQQANALCASFEKQIDDMISDGISNSSTDTNAGQAEFLAKGNTLIGDLVTQMKALPQPDELSSQLQAIYADIAQMQSVTEQGITALQQGNTAQYTTLSDQATTLSDSMDQQFDAIGVTACGSGAGSGSTTTTAD